MGRCSIVDYKLNQYLHYFIQEQKDMLEMDYGTERIIGREVLFAYTADPSDGRAVTCIDSLYSTQRCDYYTCHSSELKITINNCIYTLNLELQQNPLIQITCRGK